MTENSSKDQEPCCLPWGDILVRGKTLSSPGKVEGVSWICSGNYWMRPTVLIIPMFSWTAVS